MFFYCFGKADIANSLVLNSERLALLPAFTFGARQFIFLTCYWNLLKIKRFSLSILFRFYKALIVSKAIIVFTTTYATVNIKHFFTLFF